MKESLLCCSVCGQPLTFDEKNARCPKGHCFDRAARGGYVHLLRQHRRGSSDPGDSAAMCQARTRFLEGNWYGPLRDTVAKLAADCAPQDILDAGCGEGWYTRAVLDACPDARLAGIDLSRYALRHAGRACSSCRWPTHRSIWCCTCSHPCAPRSLRVCSVRAGRCLRSHRGRVTCGA